MAEDWVWGQEFQLGYYKHPPLTAWITAAWFHIFPRANWSFFLLSESNAALGLLGGFMIAGRFLDRTTQWAVLALLALTPLYNFGSWKFNPDTALLASWPWTVYFLVRSLETRKAPYAVAFGLLCAAAMLTKYYSALLLLSCLAAAVLHPDRRAYFRSSAPYISVAVGLAAVMPHVIWSFDTGLQAIGYALSKTDHSLLQILPRTIGSVIEAAVFHALAALVLIRVLIAIPLRAWLQRLRTGATNTSAWWIIVLTFGPYVLTLLASLIGHVRISAQFMIPIFFMVPAAVLALSATTVDAARTRRALAFVAAIYGACLVASPLQAIAAFRARTETWAEPRRDVAAAAERAWHDAFHKRLDAAGGTDAYADAIAFYGADSTSSFIELDTKIAPWMTRQRLATNGLLIVCADRDTGCADRARPYLTIDTKTVTYDHTPELWGQHLAPRHFTFYLIPSVPDLPVNSPSQANPHP